MVLKTERNVADVMDTEGDENRCCLCMDLIECWAIGKCKHPVCYICSSRMRVLGKEPEKSRECAICKQEMEFVVFHDSYFDYDSINLKSLKCKEEYGIYFFNEDSEKLYEDLISFKSPLSDFIGKDGKDLKRHMSKKHNLHECEICVEHYLLFPRERKWYTRTELATHKRKGDPDDTSHKGHPLCNFCNIRFLDEHELYRHMRREHFTCHICEVDEGCRDFFENIDELVKHYRKKHFLCEHPDCIDNPMTAVFRTELELKIHVAEKHGGINKKDLRIEAGIGHRDQKRAQLISQAQQEIEEEIDEIASQPLPNVTDQESFPSLGGKKGGTSLAGQIGPKKSAAQQSYRSLSSKNINSTEDFPSLGGGMGASMSRATPSNWNNKAKQNNKPITKPISAKKGKKTLITPSTSSYVPANPASVHVPTHDGPSNWSAEPDRFVERSQLEIRAEQEALARQNGGSKKAPAKADFPTLGGAGPKPKAFWGVPGASIPKSHNKKKASKVVSAGKPKPELTNKKSKVNNSKSVSLISSSLASASLSSSPTPSSTKSSSSKVQSMFSPTAPPSGSTASDMATRMTGGYAGWSAPPEVFQEKSLLDIEEEKRKNMKHKKQAAPKKHDFPTLGGNGNSAQPTAFWGVPGSSFPKSNSSKKTPPAKPIQNKTERNQPTVQPISFDKPARPQKKEKSVLPIHDISESQSASLQAHRMTGGNSGWSAPPEVFREKSLLEIEQEKKQKAKMNQSKKDKAAPKMDDSAFPTLGGDMSNDKKVNLAFEYRATNIYNNKFQAAPVPSASTGGFSAAELMRKAKKEEAEKQKKAEMKKKQAEIQKKSKQTSPVHYVKEIVESEDEDEFVSANEESETEEIEVHIDEEEKENSEEDNRRLINERLMSAITSMNQEDQMNFKIASGKFRTGQLNADEYIEMGCLFMGKKSFLKILPDLLQTLPNGKHKDALAKAKLAMK